MELNEQWRTVTASLNESYARLSSAQTASTLEEAAASFSSVEAQAKQLLQNHPQAAGKLPYERDYRSATAGHLLCEILKNLQELREGTTDKKQAREHIQTMAAQLLNLRADHGRFFDGQLNNGINRVERIYLKLLSQND